MARQQLQTVLGRSSSVETKKEDRIEIADGELRWVRSQGQTEFEDVDGWRFLHYTTRQVKDDWTPYLSQIEAVIEQLGGVEVPEKYERRVEDAANVMQRWYEDVRTVSDLTGRNRIVVGTARQHPVRSGQQT